MANYIGSQINQSVTIVEKAGAACDDCRNKIFKYDDNGNVVLAGEGDLAIGIGLIESGYNDVTGKESGKVAAGEDVTVQIKDIGLVKAGAAITKGKEVMANADGLAVPAVSGKHVIGIAQDTVEAGDYVYIIIQRYVKA